MATPQNSVPWPISARTGKPVVLDRLDQNQLSQLDEYDDDADIEQSDWIGSPAKYRLAFKTRNA